MSKLRNTIILLAITLLVLPGHAQSLKIYVSKKGNDEWSGNISEPLATLTAAQEKVRLLLEEQVDTIKVILRGGTYRLQEPLVFKPEDSGHEGAPVIWTSQDDEKVIISAGKVIENWKRAKGPVPGLPELAAGKVWYADIGADIKFYSLFNDHGVLKQAESGKLNTTGDRDVSEMFEDPQSFTRLHWQGNDLDDIAYVGDAVLHIVPTFFFAYNILPVKSIDRNNKILETSVRSTYPLYTQHANFAEHSYYKIANVIEHLDEPGEWVLNSKEGRIYYWPVDGEKPGDDICYPLADELVSFRGDIENRDWVRNIELHGIIFRNAERMRFFNDRVKIVMEADLFDETNATIHLRGTQNIKVKNCIVENSGGSGIRAGIYSANNQFSHNIIRNMGVSGITLIGHGPGKLADNHNNIISHNEIAFCGEIWGLGMGVLLAGSSYNHIHNNLIHHTAYHSIAVLASFDHWWDVNRHSGTPYLNFEDLHVPPDIDAWYYRRAFIQVRHNLMEYNEIHHTAHGEKIADINCFFIFGAGDGNTFRRNYLHDVESNTIHSGIRTDDWHFFTSVSENVLRNINAPGISMKEINDYENNILINCKDASFQFLLKWAFAGQQTFPLYGTNMRRNIMVQPMSSMQSDRGTRVGPFYRALWNKELLSQPMADNNIFFVPDDKAAGEEALAKAQALGIDLHSVAADPMFVDLENGDFRFREGSPARVLGIKPITKYGIQEAYGLEDEYKYLENEMNWKRSFNL